MPLLELEERKMDRFPSGTMKANVFRSPGKFGLEEKSIPKAGPGEAIVKVRLTTICGTDIHIIRGEYPVPSGLTIGHEAVGIIHELGPGVTAYEQASEYSSAQLHPADNVSLALPAIAHNVAVPWAAGAWAIRWTAFKPKYFRVPFAQANLTPIPDSLADEDVILLADIASTGFSAAESGRIRLGDTVAVFAQGPIGLCATLRRPADGCVRHLRRRR